MVHDCDPNTQEVEAGALEVQGHLRLSRALLAILGYTGDYLKKKKKGLNIEGVD